MHRTVYEDYKYSMQDVGRVYVGCKYTFGELLDNDDVLFKFRLVVERYLLPEADLNDTLETHLYYLAPDSFAVKIYSRRRKKEFFREKKETVYFKAAFGGGTGGDFAGRERKAGNGDP